LRTLIEADEIERGVARLAAELNERYAGGSLTVLGVMTGSLMLLADLVRKLEMPLRVGVIQASSYRGTTEPGELRLSLDAMPDVVDQEVLLVDDIFDTGRTIDRLTEVVAARGARSVRSAVLLLKRGRSRVTRTPDFRVFEIPDEFVVGYGLDHRDRYRNLPYVAVLEPSDLDAEGTGIDDAVSGAE